MVDIKVSLTIELPGSSMYSKQMCLENIKKEYKAKDGKIVTKTIVNEVPELHDDNVVRVLDAKGKFKQEIHFLTRKCKPAYKTTNLSKEAYYYMVSNEVPDGFNVKHAKKAWGNMNKEERLLWHLNRYAENFRGTLIDYKVFDD